MASSTGCSSLRARRSSGRRPPPPAWFFASPLSIEKSLRARGHHVLLFDLPGQELRLAASEPEPAVARVDGVITPQPPQTDEELCSPRSPRPAHPVAIGTPMPGHPCVRIDDADAMQQATGAPHLQGHRRIASSGPSRNMAHVLTPRGPSLAEETLAAHGVPLRERVLNCDWTRGCCGRVATIPRPSSPVSRRPSDRRPSSRRPTRWPSVPWPAPIAWTARPR